jgi:phosphoribosylamine-glycine ligase
MKYVFFTYEHYPLPIAYHLINEGFTVLVGMFKDPKKAGIPVVHQEKPEETKMRMTLYSGLMDMMTGEDVLATLKKVPADQQKDYFFFFDYGDMWPISEQILSMGFRNGIFPTEFYYKLEKERPIAKELVKKYYPDIKVAVSEEFTKVADGLKYIQSSKDVLVLKSNGNYGKTVVPRSDDLEIAHEMVSNTLEKYKSEYEKGGFILEKKIADCIEFTPVMVFYNGEPIYSLVEIENKEMGAGNIGVQKGGNQTLCVRTPINCKLNKIAFPEMIYRLAEKQPGLSIYDAGLLLSGGEMYFTEFCAMRYGWDGFLTECVMRDDGKPFVNNYFQDIVDGKNPLVRPFGCSLRLFNYEGNTEFTEEPKDGLPIIWDKSIDNNMFWYRIRKEGEETVCVGGMDFIGTMTGAGDTIEEAVTAMYDRIGLIDFEKLLYRPKFDFLSDDYKTSILNRLNAITEYLK